MNMITDEERIATNIRKGVLEFCVLALLARREMYGLQLANELVERGLTASEGSLYPLLARMRDAGGVTTRLESAGACASASLLRDHRPWPRAAEQLHLGVGCHGAAGQCAS